MDLHFQFYHNRPFVALNRRDVILILHVLFSCIPRRWVLFIGLHFQFIKSSILGGYVTPLQLETRF